MNHNDEELAQRRWGKKVRALSVVEVLLASTAQNHGLMNGGS
jgi:hypothetical protein